MTTNLNILGIPISFPFEPYEIQKEYMNKVLECLQNESNAVLESPTGTGKTLCLLCASLAWLTVKKAQIQAQRGMPLTSLSAKGDVPNFVNVKTQDETDFLQTPQNDSDGGILGDPKSFLGFFSFPTIIYASRTHSQLYQAMQEFKKTAYTHLRAVVIGSREQLCIHPDLINEENNSVKVHMCRLKVQTKSCQFYNRVDKLKDAPEVMNETVLDIEDLVKLGKSHRFCPYFMSKEVKRIADIIFMPYNYLLDPTTRKALGINLVNNIVIMDEAHNIERVCEESASIQLKSTDIALCLEEITDVMKAMIEEPISFDSETPKDFSADELCAVKEMFLKIEQVVDSIQIIKSAETDGITFDGDHIFTILEQAGINSGNFPLVYVILEKIVQFISTIQEGPLQRKGNSLELFNSLLQTVFQNASSEYKEKIKKCFKLHVTEEESFKKSAGGGGWLSKAKVTKANAKVLNYWCFSPGFGMDMLKEKGLRSLILTSGTLAPLKPLISELELDVSICLENPHIINENQVCIRIVNKGPDGVELNSSFQNRNNPEYLSSLGRTILNLTRIIPDGLLIFFPSYSVMEKCRQYWEQEGIWANICSQKTIYVEPKQKHAFNAAMTEYYARIKDSNYKGAIFMGVCRGKISEGLDFADTNGRAVIITGLPYPPLKDPRVVLKRQYLDRCRVNNSQLLSGSDWYNLEAIRAVNQAVGRVIRHKDDYGAIILLDSRFTYAKNQSQLSLWLRKHIKLADNFGEVIKGLRAFFRSAETNLPPVKEKPSVSAFSASQTYKKNGNFDCSTSSACASLNDSSGSSGLVTIHNRNIDNNATAIPKRRRIVLIPPSGTASSEVSDVMTMQEYITMVKRCLCPDDFRAFCDALSHYRDHKDFDDLISRLDVIFLEKFSLRYIIQGLLPYIKNTHKTRFNTYWEQMR